MDLEKVFFIGQRAIGRHKIGCEVVPTKFKSCRSDIVIITEHILHRASEDQKLQSRVDPRDGDAVEEIV